jgi:hypothetical protein
MKLIFILVVFVLKADCAPKCEYISSNQLRVEYKEIMTSMKQEGILPVGSLEFPSDAFYISNLPFHSANIR